MGGRAVRPATVVPLGLQGADEVQDLAYQTDIAKANELWARERQRSIRAHADLWCR